MGEVEGFQSICPINSLEIIQSFFAQLFDQPNVDTYGRHEIGCRACLTFSNQGSKMDFSSQIPKFY